MKAYTPASLRLWQPPYTHNIIGNGILVHGARMFIFGREGTWKSMLTLHTAYQIANGQPWFGYQTEKQPVLILQCEVMLNELRDRIITYEDGNQITSNQVYLTYEPYVKLDKGPSLADFESLVKQYKPGVVIVDPVYKVLSGHITDEYDVKLLLDRLDLLKDQYNFALILVHHSRKSQMVDGQVTDMGTDEMYGTRFKDWADTVVKVQTTSDDRDIILTFEKHRNAKTKLLPFIVHVDREGLRFTRDGTT